MKAIGFILEGVLINMQQNRFIIGIETLLVALVAALLFTWMHVPLAWMLGPLAGVMGWRMLTKRRMFWPIQLRQGALIILGYMLGSSFTRDTAGEIVHQLPYMLGSTFLIVLASMTMGYFVARFSHSNLASGFFGSVPGGLSQMVVLGEEVTGVDATVVTFMQTIRVISVVFLVPFLTLNGLAGKSSTLIVPVSLGDWKGYALFTVIAVGGALLGQKIHLPAGYLTGSLLATAIAVVLGLPAPHLPTWVITLSQLCIGTYIGLLMKPDPSHDFKRLGILTIVSSGILVVLSFLIGYVLSKVNPISVSTGFLSTAPGGMAEMGLTASMVHADLSMVSAYQLFRVFFVMFALPPLLKWWVKR